LQSEANQRSVDGMSRLLRARYGYQGPGLGAAAEWGLRWLQADRLSDWSARWFTRGNAALIVNGSMPSDVRLDLPEGPSPRSWSTKPLELARPAVSVENAAGVVLGLQVPRGSYTNIIGLMVLREQMLERLRHETGQVYDVALAYVRTSLKKSESALVISCENDKAPRVARDAIEIVQRLGVDAPEQAMVDGVIALHRNQAERDLKIDAAFQHARSLLHGEKPPEDFEEIDRQIGQVTPDMVRDLHREALDSIIMLAPPTVDPADLGLVNLVPDGALPPQAGMTATWRGPGGWPGPGATLWRDDEAFAIVPQQGDPVTVRLADVVGRLIYRRFGNYIVSKTGVFVELWPGAWNDQGLVQYLDRNIDSSLWLEIDAPPLLPRPFSTKVPARY